MNEFQPLRKTNRIQAKKGKKKNEIKWGRDAHILVIKNFVCMTEESVLTVPLVTSRPRPVSAFICRTR